MAPTVGAHGVLMGLTSRAVVSRPSEVTNLPLLKIFAYIDFGRVEFVLPPTVYEWGNEGETEVIRTSLNQMCFAAHVWRPPCRNGLGGSRVTSN